MSSRALLVEKVYGSAVLVLSGYDKKQAKRTAEDWFTKQGCPMELEFEESRASTYENGRNFVIWLRDAFDIRSLAHEAVHVGVSLMNHIGHDVTKGDEPLAYYVDYIVGEAMGKL